MSCQFPGCCCKRTWRMVALNIAETESHVFFRLLWSYQRSVPFWGVCERFVTRSFLRWGIFSTLPNRQAGGPPFVSCPGLLIEYIRSYPPSWWLFFRAQPEDAPSLGNRVPLIMDVCLCYLFFSFENIAIKTLCFSSYFNLCYLQH